MVGPLTKRHFSDPSINFQLVVFGFIILHYFFQQSLGYKQHQCCWSDVDSVNCTGIDGDKSEGLILDTFFDYEIVREGNWHKADRGVVSCMNVQVGMIHI